MYICRSERKKEKEKKKEKKRKKKITTKISPNVICIFVDLNFKALTLEDNPACNSIDLEDITTNWAWKMFNRLKTAKQRKKKNLSLEIDWSGLIPDNSDTLWCDYDHGGGMHRSPMCNVVVHEKFENDTDETMEHVVTLNKTTKTY